MKDHDQYLGKNSQEVVFDLLHSFGAEYFFLMRYIPKTKSAGDRLVVFKLADIPELPDLLKIIGAIPDSEQSLVGIFSRLFTKTALRHIPMIDFSNSIVGEYGTDRVKEVMETLGQKSGVILESGRCYHFYGFLPMSSPEWLNFMKKGLKFGEIGPKYITHQIADRGCTLRVSTNSYRPSMPKVIDFLHI